MPPTTAFISHADEDRDAAMAFKASLEAEGIRCWCFEVDLRHGGNMDEEVKKAIEESDCFMLILSEHSRTSQWVAWELGHAIQLHHARGGVDRPIIVPLHDYDDLPTSLAMQPLRFRTDEPYDRPVPFDRHRCFRLRDRQMLPVLVGHITPTYTRITDPCDDHERLFAGFASLVPDLFPNPLDRPDVDEVREWLEMDLSHPDAQEWPELLIASHVGDRVTGFAYLNYSERHAIAYASFLGISPAWRSRTTMRGLIDASLSKLTEACPHCRGILFQVEPIERRWFDDPRRASANADLESTRLRRINLFQTIGSILLCDADGTPVRVPQPCLRPPLTTDLEQEHFIMLLPVQRSETFTFDEAMARMFLSLFWAGFGPPGVNIPGYAPYLAGFEARLRESLPQPGVFGKMYFTPSMRDAMRRV